jgi:hypothetical protein
MRDAEHTLPVDVDTAAEIASTTPLKEAIKEVANVITCLYRLSVAIQNPSSRNRLERLEKLDMSFFEAHDIAHVSNKYPRCENYLIDRPHIDDCRTTNQIGLLVLECNTVHAYVQGNGSPRSRLSTAHQPRSSQPSFPIDCYPRESWSNETIYRYFDTLHYG